MNPLKLLLSAFRRIVTAVTNPFRMLLVRVQRLFNVNVLTAKLVAPLTRKVRSLITLKPQSREDYLPIGKYWIYKKVFMTLVLVVCAGVFLYFMVFAPPLKPKVTQPEAVKTDVSFDYDDMALREFSGVANIRAADGQVVYTGQVDKGVCSGEGTLWDRKGRLVYAGSFANNRYNGNGTAYYPSGNVKYTGGFADNLYSGAGKLTADDGALLYDGNFQDGLYDGQGKAYAPGGALLYEGGFTKGRYHGDGVLYREGGLTAYAGQFYEGSPQGVGTLYTAAGKELYTGPVYGGKINYPALVGASLQEVEAAFAETPVVAYTSTDSCFIFEQAGVIVSTDCRVQVDRWQKPKSADEQAKEYYYMPEGGAQPADPAVPDAPAPDSMLPPEEAPPDAPAPDSFLSPEGTALSAGGGGLQVRTLSAMEARRLWPAWVVAGGSPSGSSSSASGSGSSGSSSSGPSGSGSSSSSGDARREETSSQAAQPAPAPQEERPAFIEENRTLYFEIDRNVWQAEKDLDKQKVTVKKVTVIGTAALPEQAQLWEDSTPVAVEDCVAIDAIRRSAPTAFSNVVFEMDKQNKLFLYIRNISYADRVVRQGRDADGLRYIYCSPLDAPGEPAYYSITSQT